MQYRPLGPFSVANVALGCMNFCHAYGNPVSTEQSHAVLHAALDAGVTLFDTAALYGFGASESLIGPVLKPHRNQITLASKCGMAGVRGEDGVMRRVIDGRPKTLRQNCEDSLKRLGTDVIDLYYLHRWDRNVPIEESVGEMARLKEEGKVRALGLSEVGADALRRAHKEHPIAALQSEYSLWSRNAELGTLAACKELGISPEGIHISCKPFAGPGGPLTLAKFKTEVRFPEAFSAEQKTKVLDAITHCAVKNIVEVGNGIEFSVTEA